jgi:nitroimidazol reductase NimA-like FMN-containing flavoprotein (pyridoxamine 5'-phosphate oxidase superfamily)
MAGAPTTNDPTVDPTVDLDRRFGEPDVAPTTWPDAERHLTGAELYWIASVRADGRPHVTPLIAVWHDGAIHICTGPDEQKARNIVRNPHVTVTTGANRLHEGVDVVLEGDARRVQDDAALRAVAAAYEAKYGDEWHFEVRDGAFHHSPGGEPGAEPAHVFRIAPATVFAFGKDPYSQTRFRF